MTTYQYPVKMKMHMRKLPIPRSRHLQDVPERNSTHMYKELNYILFVIVKSQIEPKGLYIVKISSNNGIMYIVRTTATYINMNLKMLTKKKQVTK